MPDIYKVVITVPEGIDADRVREAIGQAGGGRQGNYGFCSFSVKGTGRFLPLEGAHPAIGEVGKLETVNEERIEVTCELTELAAVTEAIRRVHPYEEPAIDIYQLTTVPGPLHTT